eukprot:scaffold2270_cov242-Ochromonas_danica.AAC.4
MYVVMPGESQLVEANPDPIGLKVGILYNTLKDSQEFLFHRFSCKNDSVLTITAVEGDDIDYYGDGTNLQAKGKLRESDIEPFNMAAECLQREQVNPNTVSTNGLNQAALAAGHEMKKLFKKVKDTSEAAIKTVTGKEVKLDFPASSRHSVYTNNNIPPSPSNQSLEDVSQLTDDSYHTSSMNGILPVGSASSGKISINGFNNGGYSSSQQQQQQQQQQQPSARTNSYTTSNPPPLQPIQPNATSAALKMFANLPPSGSAVNQSNNSSNNNNSYNYGNGGIPAGSSVKPFSSTSASMGVNPNNSGSMGGNAANMNIQQSTRGRPSPSNAPLPMNPPGNTATNYNNNNNNNTQMGNSISQSTRARPSPSNPPLPTNLNNNPNYGTNGSGVGGSGSGGAMTGSLAFLNSLDNKRNAIMSSTPITTSQSPPDSMIMISSRNANTNVATLGSNPSNYSMMGQQQQQSQQQPQQPQSPSNSGSVTMGNNLSLREQMQQVVTSSKSAEEIFAQELERKKKEQLWEEEVNKIKREREERARNPEPVVESSSSTSAAFPTDNQQQLPGNGPPVVDAGCHVCTIS